MEEKTSKEDAREGEEEKSVVGRVARNCRHPSEYPPTSYNRQSARSSSQERSFVIRLYTISVRVCV